MREQDLRKHRCCFTGHRPEKLNISESCLRQMLDKEIDQAIQDGFTVFLSGMAKGVDINAAELVLKRREIDPRLKLVCVLPFDGFGLHWSSEWTNRYLSILNQADRVQIVCKNPSMSAYQRRNEWMVDRSARVIAVYHGAKGGTKNTIDYAKRNQVPCVILTP